MKKFMSFLLVMAMLFTMVVLPADSKVAAAEEAVTPET